MRNTDSRTLAQRVKEGDREAWEQLVQRVNKGEQEAWAQMVDILEPSIREKAAVTGREHWLQASRDSEDNVGSTLLLAIRKGWAAQFQGRSFKEAVAFVRKAARRVLLKHIRADRADRRDVKRKVHLELGRSVADKGQQRPDEAMAEEEEVQRLFALVRSACSDDAEFAMCKRKLEGETFADLARELKLAKATVRTGFRKVMEKVIQTLQRESHDRTELGS